MERLPFELFSQQLHASPVSGAELETYGKEASARWHRGQHRTLSEAVADTVKEADLSPEQVKRVVEFANTDAFLQEFHKEGENHKYVDFGEGVLADPSTVLHDLNDGGDTRQVYSTSAYNQPPEARGLQDREMAELFGSPHEEEPEADIDKEFYEADSKLSSAIDVAVGNINSAEYEYGEISDAMYQQVKTASRNGTSLGDIVKAWSVATDDPVFIKAAFSYVADRLAQDGMHDENSIGASLQKLSSARVVNASHPIVASFGGYCGSLEKLAQARSELEWLETTKAELGSLYKVAAGEAAAKEVAKRGVIGAIRRASGPTGKAGKYVGRILGGAGSMSENVGGYVGKALPTVAALGAGYVGAKEIAHRLRSSPAANLAAAYLMPGSRQYAQRQAMDQAEAMDRAANLPFLSSGLKYM